MKARLWFVAYSVALTSIGCSGAPAYTGQPEFDLRRAASSGDCSKIEALLQAGVNVDAVSSNGYTAMHEAASEGEDQAVLLLARHGAKLDVQAGEGITPLVLAIMRNHPETARLLVKLGANPDLADPTGLTAEQFADRFGIKLR